MRSPLRGLWIALAVVGTVALVVAGAAVALTLVIEHGSSLAPAPVRLAPLGPLQPVDGSLTPIDAVSVHALSVRRNRPAPFPGLSTEVLADVTVCPAPRSHSATLPVEFTVTTAGGAAWYPDRATTAAALWPALDGAPQLAPGRRCAEGTMTFSVPAPAEPLHLDVSSLGVDLRWTIPGARPANR